MSRYYRAIKNIKQVYFITPLEFTSSKTIKDLKNIRWQHELPQVGGTPFLQIFLHMQRYTMQYKSWRRVALLLVAHKSNAVWHAVVAVVAGVVGMSQAAP